MCSALVCGSGFRKRTRRVEKVSNNYLAERETERERERKFGCSASSDLNLNSLSLKDQAPTHAGQKWGKLCLASSSVSRKGITIKSITL